MRNIVITTMGLLGLLCASPAVQAQELTDRTQLAGLAAEAQAMAGLVDRLSHEPLGEETTALEWLGGTTLPLGLVIQVAGATELRPVAVQQGGDELVAAQAGIAAEEFVLLLAQYVAGKDDEEPLALPTYAADEVLTASGFGEIHISGRMLMVTADASVDSPEYLRGTPHAYWQTHCTEQGRVRTVLAARDDALANLAETLKAIPVPGAANDRTLGDLVGEQFAELAAGSFLNGARATGIRYTTDDLQVDVQVEASLQDVVLAVKGYMANRETPDAEATGLLEQWVVAMQDEPVEAEGTARVAREFRKDGGDALFFLGQVVGRFGLEQEAIIAEGSAAVDDSIDDIAEARRLAYAAAAYEARLTLAERVATIALDEDEDVTLGELMAADEAVRQAVWMWLTLADVTPGSGDIDADNIATLTVELPVAPLADIVRGISIGRVVEAQEPEVPSTPDDDAADGEAGDA